jgi:Pyruvate/2-oxoacid:ferredoxin oxidoreductase delta subunit
MTQTVITNPERCTECQRCQLACSYHNTGEFNINAANIMTLQKGIDVDIVFTDSCRKFGICASYCAYGARAILYNYVISYSMKVVNKNDIKG